MAPHCGERASVIHTADGFRDGRRNARSHAMVSVLVNSTAFSGSTKQADAGHGQLGAFLSFGRMTELSANLCDVKLSTSARCVERRIEFCTWSLNLTLRLLTRPLLIIAGQKTCGQTKKKFNLNCIVHSRPCTNSDALVHAKFGLFCSGRAVITERYRANARLPRTR